MPTILKSTSFPRVSRPRCILDHQSQFLSTLLEPNQAVSLMVKSNNPKKEMTLLNPTDTSPNLEQPGRFLRANMTVNHDPESIVNEPGHGFLGHLASCIQRYPYRGRQQFLVDFEAERHRHRTNTSGHVSEWFLLTGVDNLIFRSEFIEPVDQNTPWTSWDSYDAHLQLLLDQVTCSRDRLHDFSQNISGSCRAHRAKALPQGDR